MKQILRILAMFFGAAAVMAVLKPLFMLVVGGFSLADVPAVVFHGLSMDFSVASYLTLALLIPVIASVWISRRWLERAMWVYVAGVAILIAFVSVADAALYPYWGFKIDTTPIFYFLTSPSSAMASLNWWQWGVAALVTAVLAIAIWLWFRWLLKITQPKECPRRPVAVTIALVALGAVMVIPLRGGVTVSTMSPARAYFSRDMRLNHAAINPEFSLLYSALHSAHPERQFRYMDPEQAAEVMERLKGTACHDGTPLSDNELPDIYLIILESFSAHLMPSLGGENVAPRLDSIARDGWSFTEAYASSFRTDRALPAVLCAYPAQPTTSLLKFISKLDGLPSLPSLLKRRGYEMTYYYGGDIDFTNVRAMLVAAGFDHIVSDEDFPVNQRLSKWGVHDGPVFDRALADVGRTPSQPRLTVVQTSSSHEPYEVPYVGRFENPRQRAFEYADSCFGTFIDGLSALPSQRKRLIIIVADHYGSWPEQLTDPKERHHIPLVFTGNFLEDKDLDASLLSLPASQTDIAATVCSMLGVDHSELPFSSDLFCPDRVPFAYFSEPSWVALCTPEECAVVSTDTGMAISAATDSLVEVVKAYTQTLYDDLSRR